MKFIKKHKVAFIILVVLIAILIGLFLFLRTFMIDSKKDEYGNRLEGINNVQISSDTTEKMKEEIKTLEEVENITYRLQGKLIYISLEVRDGVAIDIAKEISSRTLNYFNEEEKAYYDIQIIVTSTNQENEGYPFMGYKHKTEPALVW